MIPKIEDGNNFGVEIQHETIETMTEIENEIRERLNCFTRYYAVRGDLTANVSEYPHSEDFRRAVQENDEKFHLSLCQTVIRVRDHYASLHDLVTKNLSKLKKPRSANKQMLY
jgi:proteasome activator subunit 3 (PA28 gamma)